MIKPIETRYNAYRFRSRLEARWAVFFDALGITYEYETEGFDLGASGWYLPDFLLKPPNARWNFWVEVKPMLSKSYIGYQWYDIDDPKVDMKAFNKIATLVESGHRFRDCKYGLVIFGEPGKGRHQVLISTDSDSFGSPEDTMSSFGICSRCGSLVVGFEYWLQVSALQNSTYQDRCGCYEADTSAPILLKAFQTALQTRFEHGETPKI
jgi:hypothetical protein